MKYISLYILYNIYIYISYIYIYILYIYISYILYIYICMHVFVFIYIYIHMCVYLYRYIYIYVYTGVYVYRHSPNSHLLLVAVPISPQCRQSVWRYIPVHSPALPRPFQDLLLLLVSIQYITIFCSIFFGLNPISGLSNHVALIRI